MKLISIKVALTVLIMTISNIANAGLITYQIDFGVDGSGTFDIDSTDLAAAPGSGLYFAPSNTVSNFSATVLGETYDMEDSGVFLFAMNNGLLSGVTGITSSKYKSSITAAILQLNTCSGLPCNSTANGTAVTYSIIPQSLLVPEPPTFAILALGMIGLALRRFKKQS